VGEYYTLLATWPLPTDIPGKVSQIKTQRNKNLICNFFKHFKSIMYLSGTWMKVLTILCGNKMPTRCNRWFLHCI